MEGMIKVWRWGWKCLRCGEDWIPRNKEERPRSCPKCKSACWDKPKKKVG